MPDFSSSSYRRLRPATMTVVATVIVLVANAAASGQVRRLGQTARPVRDTPPRAGSHLAPAIDVAPGCQLHDTCVSWASDPETAREMARDQKKLLFVMHLSGNFANPTFT